MRRYSAEEADDWLTERGFVLRRVTGYGFPNALRMTIGSEEACRGALEQLRALVGRPVRWLNEPIFDKLCLIGIGLIGASIAIRARRDGLVRHIAISTRSADTLARAEELGLGDSYTIDAGEAVVDADCVIICTPVGAMGAVARVIGPHLKPGCILSDAGSVKRSVIDQIAPHIADDVHFIPGHPIAGTEHSGPDAGFATLFDKRWHLLTPVPGHEP